MAIAVAPSSPEIVYVTTMANGVFKSADAGLHWARASQGLPEGTSYSLAVDPADPDRVYTAAGGGYVSSDGGDTWTSAGWPVGAIFSITISPSAPSTIYVVGQGVMRTDDGGATWERVFVSYDPLGILKLAVDPTDPLKVYAATSAKGVLASTDGGATYREANAGIQTTYVTNVIVNPQNPLLIYAAGASYQPGQVSGIYRSLDGGGTWDLTTSGLTGTFRPVLVMNQLASNELVADTGSAMYRTLDGAISWQPVARGAPDFSAIIDMAFAGMDRQALLTAPVEVGIQRSTDLGETWTDSSEGLSAYMAISMAVSPSDPRRLFVGGSPWLYSSEDGGSTWRQMPIGSLGFSVNDVLLLDDSPSSLFVFTGNAGAWRSTDLGQSFAPLRPDLFGQNVRVLAVDPTKPARFFVQGDFGPFKTSDGGLSWTAFSAPSGYSGFNLLAEEPGNGSVLYGVAPSGAFLRSIDGGANWSAPQQQPPVGFTSVLADWDRQGTVIVAGDGVALSADRGDHWTVAGARFPSGVWVNRLYQDPERPNIFFAATTAGILKSYDGCSSWSPLNCGLTLPAIQRLALVRSGPPTVYAVTYGAGVFAMTERMVVDKLTKYSNPFRITVFGKGFPRSIRVYVNGAEWPKVTWKGAEKIVLKGATLKRAIPKGVPADFLFVDPDGTSVALTWLWR